MFARIGILGLALAAGAARAEDAPAAPRPAAELQLETDAIGASFSPDGAWLATTGHEVICLWDTATRRERWKQRIGAPAAMAWSDDGAMLALATGDGAVRVWTVADLHREPVKFNVRQGHLSAIAFSSDGKLLACGGAHPVVSLWDPGAPRELRQFQRQSNWWIGSVGFAANGRQLVAGGYDGFLRIWDCESGKEMHKLPVPAFTSVAISPDGKALITNVGGDRFRVWETATGQPRQDFGRHGPLDLTPILSADGRLMAERAKNERHVRLWDRIRGERLAEIDGAGPFAFSADAQLLAVALGKTVRLWPVRTFMPERPAAKPLTMERLESLWLDLGGAPAVAYSAILALADSPTEAAPFLRKQVCGPFAAEKVVPDKLIADLDNDAFEVRDRAQRQLTAMGAAVEPALREALRRNPSPEMRLRIQQILAELAAAIPGPAELQHLRAIEALELASTRASLEAIQSIAQADLPAAVRRDAQGAVWRFKRRLGLRPAVTRPSD